MNEESCDCVTIRDQILDLMERHRVAELEERNVDATLDTMVDAPYIYMAPAFSGGVDEKEVRAFYKVMLSQLPADMEWISISSTIEEERAVLESILKFTHDIQVDWLLPGLPPTGKNAEIPMVLIFSFADGKIASERIYWDQASTLVQLGVLEKGELPIVGEDSPKRLRDITGKSN